MSASTNPISGATNAVAMTSDATWRYCAMYTLDFGMLIGRQAVNSPTSVWTTHKLAGAEVTAMGLPLIKDTHAYPGIALLGDGKLAVWGNMHGGTTTNDQLRMIITTNGPSSGAADISAWSSATLPSVGTRCSYPTPVQLPDGRVFFMIRDTGISALGDWGCWFCPAGSSTFGARATIFQGLAVPNAGGPGVTGGNSAAGDTVDNWSAYPTRPVVHDYGNGRYKMAMMGTWRVFGAPASMQTWATANSFGTVPSVSGVDQSVMACTTMFYVEYRSWTDTWHAIDGTQVFLPFDPVNTTAIRTGLVPNDDRGAASTLNAQGVITSLGWNYANEGGFCLDAQDHPHYMLGRSPHYHITHDGTSWVQTRLTTSGQSLALGGGKLGFTPIGPLLMNGEIWWLCTGESFTSPISARMLLAKPDGSTYRGFGSVLPITAEVNTMLQPPPATGNFALTLCFAPDPEGLRRRGTLEVMVPVGDTPRTEMWGNGMRAVAH